MMLNKILLILLLMCSPAAADEYYLVQPVCVECPGHPDGCWDVPHTEFLTGRIDFRSNPQESIVCGDTPEGYLVASYSEQINDAKMIYLGSGKDGVLQNKS